MPCAQGFGSAAGLLAPCGSTCCFLVNSSQYQAKNYHYRYSLQILLHRKSHEADLVKEALRRETQALLPRLNQIKELLTSSEIRTKISKELFEDGRNSSSKWKSCTDSESPNA